MLCIYNVILFLNFVYFSIRNRHFPQSIENQLKKKTKIILMSQILWIECQFNNPNSNPFFTGITILLCCVYAVYSLRREFNIWIKHTNVEKENWPKWSDARDRNRNFPLLDSYSRRKYRNVWKKTYLIANCLTYTTKLWHLLCVMA